MVEVLTNTVSIAILVSGLVFYVLGHRAGYKRGFSVSTEATVDVLIEKGYLKYHKTKDGEKEFIKFKE